MGTPLDIETFQPGSQCPLCWGPDKTFGDNPTPADPFIQFHDWSEGSEFLEVYRQELTNPHRMLQDANPCRWTFAGPFFFWEFTYDLPTAALALSLKVPPTDLAFLQVAFPPCLLDYPNFFSSPAGTITFNGRISFTFF